MAGRPFEPPRNRTRRHSSGQAGTTYEGNEQVDGKVTEKTEITKTVALSEEWETGKRYVTFEIQETK